MKWFLSRYADYIYALMRMVTGFLFFWHGSQKLLGFPPSPYPNTPAYILYIAGPIELIGGALVLLGWYTRSAAFICSGMCAFAYWLAHGTRALLPIQNGGELAALYCFVFLFIAARGAGPWGVDRSR